MENGENGLYIRYGIITKNGKIVAEAYQDLKNGFHPAILVEIKNGKNKWFEMDTPNLVSEVLQYIHNNI